MAPLGPPGEWRPMMVSLWSLSTFLGTNLFFFCIRGNKKKINKTVKGIKKFIFIVLLRDSYNICGFCFKIWFTLIWNLLEKLFWIWTGTPLYFLKKRKLSLEWDIKDLFTESTCFLTSRRCFWMKKYEAILSFFTKDFHTKFEASRRKDVKLC